MKKTGLLIVMLILFFSCKNVGNTPFVDETKRGLIVDSAMVVSARAEASKIGADILKMGGNAFDAMAATQLALGVAYPYAGNIGGGGFMVYRMADGEIGSVDFREKAPLASTKDMFLNADGEFILEKSTLGALAVGVPGSVAGVYAVHDKLGSLPMEEIIKPVIALASRGVVVTETTCRWEPWAFVQRAVAGSVASDRYQ